MKLPKKIILLSLIFLGISLFKTPIDALDYDFLINQDTTVNYTTGNDYVDVKIQFDREIKNSSYYFSANGEQIFHIPDSVGKSDEEIKQEREFKKSSISVTTTSGSNTSFTVEELEIGEGMYVKVPNYKETRYGSKYTVYVRYKVHDYVVNNGGLVKIEYPALDKETKLEMIDEESGTKTKISYNLDIVVDSKIPPLAKIYPEKFESSTEKESTTYSFASSERIGIPVLIEFGKALLYRFELTMTTEKTDSIIPEKYSENFQTISTNIYEIALPREYAETSQTVKIDDISPEPTKISMDDEGNIIATFEVPANKVSEISISGYIWVTQPTYEEGLNIPTLTYEEYISEIKKDSNLLKYLNPTSFWEVNDEYIKTEANTLLENKSNIIDIIRGDYTFVGEKITYDEEIAESLLTNERIGAKRALQSGSGVCVEYADALTAILRAQGIPSRVAFGYSNSGIDKYAQAGHAWVQAWIPQYGWLSIDPTYEGVNQRIGPNIDLILWDTQEGEEDKRMRVFSADTVTQEGDNLKIKVYPLDENEIENVGSLRSYSDIQFESDEYSTKDMVNIAIKTTPIGKALIIILPIGIVLLLIILLLSLSVTLIRRIKTRKASPNQQP
jgi:transglutaminase-like putative cysteine protease